MREDVRGRAPRVAVGVFEAGGRSGEVRADGNDSGAGAAHAPLHVTPAASR